MKTILINHRPIPFELRRNKRAKRLILRVQSDTPKIILTIPRFTVGFQVSNFLRKQETWLIERLEELERNRANRPILERSPAYYKARAKKQIRERLNYFNQHYQFGYQQVFFKDQKTRWGSCSSQKNLNFNWRLTLAPLEILDYVVVHELCHLKQMNHSKAFWNLVEEQIPDHKEKRKWLRQNQHLLSLN